MMEIPYSHPLAIETDRQLRELTYPQWHSQISSAHQDLFAKIETICREHLPCATTSTASLDNQVWRSYMRLHCELIEITQGEVLDFLHSIYTHLPRIRNGSFTDIERWHDNRCIPAPIYRWRHKREDLLTINIKVCEIAKDIHQKLEIVLDPLRLQLYFIRCTHENAPSEKRHADRFNQLWHRQLRSHEYVVPLLHHFPKQDGWSVSVLDYCAGGDLYEWLKRPGKKAPWSQRCQIAHEILKYIAALHSQESKEEGIAHGDLKLENIALTREGHVRFLDWECATMRHRGRYRVLNREERESYRELHKYVWGTPDYWAPELIRGCVENGPHRGNLFPADVWALGWILSELFKKEIYQTLSDWLEDGLKEVYKNYQSGHVYFQKRNLYREVRKVCKRSLINYLIVRCLHPSPRKRLTSQKVLSIFEAKIWAPLHSLNLSQ